MYTKDDLSFSAPSPQGRSRKETEVFAKLDALGIPYAWLSHEVKMTVYDCMDIYEALDIKLCKNLFLVNRQGRHYMLMIQWDKKFVTKDVSRAAGSSRLQFAGEDKLMEYMNTTPGSVSVLGLMYDERNMVQLLIDRDVLREKYVGMHPCVNTTSLRMTPEDLTEKFLPAVHHEPIIIDIPGDAGLMRPQP